MLRCYVCGNECEEVPASQNMDDVYIRVSDTIFRDAQRLFVRRRKDGSSRTEIGRERQSSNNSKMTKVGRDPEVTSNKERKIKQRRDTALFLYSCTSRLRLNSKGED